MPEQLRNVTVDPEGVVFKNKNQGVTWRGPGSSAFWFCDDGQSFCLFTYEMGMYYHLPFYSYKG